jgi:polyisoprenyl-teichoic acid--peptidoglycan teichoic acid transferase
VSRARRFLRRLPHLAALAAVLGVCALVVPDSGRSPTTMELVRLKQADGVDLTGSAKDVLWILAVGSDARPGEDMTHTRGDALHLIGIDTKTGAAADIGVPRDSWVDIAGHGYDKINASLYYGGPELLGKTVGQLFGLAPQYVFVTSFPMFQRMIASIGGVDVDNPIAFSDEYLKPKGFPEGHIHLNGYDALAFSRIRHALLRGDFDRSANQDRVLAAIQRKVRERSDQPGFMEREIAEAMHDMATNASPAELFRLARAVADIKPSKVTSCVLQGGIGDIGGASVVLPYVDQARALGDEARDDATLETCSPS